jgi:hypothetical protein
VVADGGIPIEARIGANTGEVVVRSITTGQGHTEYTPIGHTTNLASRMQAVAPTSSIAISEQTRKFVEGYFLLKALGPTRVKGVSAPVNVYEVTGSGALRTRLQRAAGRGFTKFVGRQREMEAMKAAAERAKAGHGQIVAAMGDAGVGKSRLFYEFKAVAQDGCLVLEAFSVSHGKASSYLPVVELLKDYFGIMTEDDERRRREKVTGKILTLERALENALPLRVRAGRRGGDRRRNPADGPSVAAAAHARRDQADSVAREPQSAAHHNLRGSALDRWRNAGAAKPARRIDQHRKDSIARELPPRILARLGQQDLLRAIAAGSTGSGERGRVIECDDRRRGRVEAA